MGVVIQDVQVCPQGAESELPSPVKGDGRFKKGQTGRWVKVEEHNAVLRRVKELEASLSSPDSRDADGGVVTSVRMRKILGQEAVLDVGPTERSLRVFLERDFFRYEGRMRELEAVERGQVEKDAELVELRLEVKELRAARDSAREVAEVADGGSDRARELIDSCLRG